MPFTSAQLLSFLAADRYLVLFPLAVLEGPLVTIFSGFLSAFNLLNLVYSFLLITAGDLVADSLYYALGRWRNGQLAKRWSRFFGLNPADFSRLETQFHGRGGQLLLMGKLSYGTGGAFLVAAGVAGMPFMAFLGVNLLATIPKTLVLLLLGYCFGFAFGRVGSGWEFVALLVLGLSCLSFLAYYFYYQK